MKERKFLHFRMPKSILYLFSSSVCRVHSVYRYSWLSTTSYLLLSSFSLIAKILIRSAIFSDQLSKTSSSLHFRVSYALSMPCEV